MTTVLAIDPGSLKCGVALVSGTPGSDATAVIEKTVVERQALSETVTRILDHRSPAVILIGDGTRHQDVLREVRSLTDTPVQVVDERETTLAARKLYFLEHPPRGWRRLIPLSMQVPPQSYDDYVAVLLAKRYLAL